MITTKKNQQAEETFFGKQRIDGKKKHDLHKLHVIALHKLNLAFIKDSEKDLKELFTQLHPLEIQHMQQYNVLDLELLGEKQTLELKQQLELLISEQRTARQNLNKKQQQEIKDLGENLKKKVDKKNFKSAFEKESKLLKEKHTKEIQEFDEQLQKQKTDEEQMFKQGQEARRNQFIQEQQEAIDDKKKISKKKKKLPLKNMQMI